MSNINEHINYSRVGLATDLVPDQIKTGLVTDALNAVVQNFDGQSISYQNETGDRFCFITPSGYKVVGEKSITQLNRVLYCLANPTTGFSLVSYVDNNNCTLQTLLDDSIPGSDLIGFNINHPIHKIEVKTTNCSTQVYITDNFNPRRFIDFSNLPFKTGTTNQVDINKMLIQPVFNIPKVNTTAIHVGGNIIEGCYQFAFQYANQVGDGLTGYYSVTNPVRIFLDHHMSPNYNEVTNKSITVDISDIDTTGLYSYFNLAVIKTINGALAGVDYLGTFSIQSSTYQYIYTGQEQANSNIKLSITDIMEQYDYYDRAGILTQVDNVLVWGDLTKAEDISYQKIFNQVNVGWGTWAIPETQPEGYRNGVNCANIEGHFRDEVVPLEGCVILDNGKEGPRCHIPGRIANAFDLETIGVDNQDIETSTIDPCTTPIPQPRWKVYNTGYVTSTDPGFIPGDTCYKGPYQYGVMSYWESEKKYPNKPEVWGPLANQPIRHHKFPDSTITHIHDQNPYVIGTEQYNNYIHTIYPIGFVVDIDSLYQAIQSSPDLTDAQKRQIVGFKIMRGDRIGNESVVARGYLSNCGAYTKDGTTYFYPNYPFGDLHADPFISSQPVPDKSGAQPTTNWLQNFQQGRFMFHSPDTHFTQVSGIQGSFLKLETAEYGTCKAHFIKVQDNAGEKLRTKKTLEIAFAGGIMSLLGFKMDFSFGFPTGVAINPGININPQNFFPTFQAVLDIIDKLIPYTNYGWQYNGIGYYGNYFPIPDNGNKQRYIQYGGYIVPGLNGTFGDTSVATSINNTNRESAVFLSLGTKSLPYTHQQDISIPQDNSRVTAGQLGLLGKSTPFYRDISTYYATIKRFLPDQYGEIFSYAPIDTGFYSKFFDNLGNQIKTSPVIFGGDCFITPFSFKIKHPFYLKSSVNKGDGTDIDYNQDAPSHTNTGNVGYPIWYYSTSNEVFDVNNAAINQAVNTFMTTFPAWYNIFLGGIPTVAATINLLITLINQGLLTSLGIKITNLEGPGGGTVANNFGLFETGQAYLYAYGIPRLFVESQVNVDMRQAYNHKEGDFYPNVGTDIPDDWLQETNVSITYDNTYTYNTTYSKQNRETFFPLLRLDWEPHQQCFTFYNNRAIWSDKSDLEETKNNWLVYKPANMKDFPKSFGKIIAMDTLENRQVLVRYENRSQIYNALATIATSGLTAALGTGDLFSGVPLDLGTSDSGYAGSQHKFISNTEHGHIYIDAKRAQVLLLKGNSVEELSGEKYLNNKWFGENLPFHILQKFPSVDIDNNFNGLGLHGVYDDVYKRVIITKLDYEPLLDNIKFDGTNFYIDDDTIINKQVVIPGTLTCCPDSFTYSIVEKSCFKTVGDVEERTDPIMCPDTITQENTSILNKKIISLQDPKYFCNKSWTISFSFITNTWISKHSYQPNFYVEYENYFQAGLNNGNFANIWDHNSIFDKYNTFFGVIYPYILEVPFAYKEKDEILQSVQDYSTVLKYTDFNQFVEPNEIYYFNKVTVYNNQQCSGLNNLIPRDLDNLQQNILYPIYNPTSTDILVTKSDHFYNFNMIWDKVRDANTNIWINTCGTTTGEKVLNNSNLDYTNNEFKKYPLRAKDSKVRLILDSRNDIKIISKFIIQQTQNSYK